MARGSDQFLEDVVEDDVEELLVIETEISSEADSECGPTRDHLVREGKTICHLLDDALPRARGHDHLSIRPAPEYFARLEPTDDTPHGRKHPLCSQCWKFAKVIYPELTES